MRGLGPSVGVLWSSIPAPVLNRFFRGYLASHSQGGTNTKQRNLRHLFTWLAIEYGHPHPYTDGLVRYAPVKVRPSTLRRLHQGPALGDRGRAGACVR